MSVQDTPEAGESPVEFVVTEFVGGFVTAIPSLLAGLIFVTLAYLFIRLVRSVLRSVLTRIYADNQKLIADLVVTVVSLFLWFGAGLTVLTIVGMEEVAASLGTATGFIALGVAFALQEMIADTVAGVYLLRDPDFNEGDYITTASVTGTITGIDLRKTRIRADDETLVVVANRDVEKRWTQEKPASGE